VAMIQHNDDGSVILTLLKSITIDGEKLERVTLRALTGKDMRKATFTDEPTVGQMIDLAAHVVEPPGAIDVMGAADACDAGLAVGQMLGKSRTSGAQGSAA
jgi:hypothetical protein